MPSADQIKVASGKTVTIFDIKTHGRLVASVHCNHQMASILLLLAHCDYDQPH
ncbi:MAG TPA: hypothetical protein VGF85_13075 [Opitutaceae bacterium]